MRVMLCQQRSSMLLFSPILVLMLIGIFDPAPQAFSQARPAAPPNSFDAAVDTLIKKVSPSVVQIIVTAYAPLQDADRGNAGVVFGKQRASGSGFVIDPDGYIITNAHVVSGAQRVQVVLPPAQPDGSLATALSTRIEVVPAKIIGVAKEKDLALLKIDGAHLPALPLAAYRDLRQGHGNSTPILHRSLSRRMRRSIPEIRGGRSLTSTAKSSASTPSFSRSPAGTKDWDSRSRVPRSEPSSGN